MSRNGSGVYSLPAGNPVVTGTTISSTWANNTLSDMANALTGSVASDGQTPMTGNLQMGNNKITGLANGTNAQDAVTYSQLTGLAPATSGSSVLAGNGAGGFTNVTLATGLTYSGGTLTANINTLLPDQSGKSGYVLTTDGSATSWGTAGGNGTVTSVALSGGTTGITVSGSPITSSGTMTLAGTLAVTSGGTGATSASGALTNLLPSQSGQSGRFLTTNGTSTSWASAGTGTVTSVSGTGTVSGLTLSGTVTSSGSLTLGGTLNASQITSGTLAVANGGTGSSSLAGAGIVTTSGAQTISGTKTFTNYNSFGAASPSTSWNIYVKSQNSEPAVAIECGNSTSQGLTIFSNASTVGQVFYFGSATVPNAAVGTIALSSTATTYNTSSDYRLKEDVKPMVNAISKIKELNPVTYTWKINGEKSEGFIAHELQAVFPQAVTGTKDEVDEKGQPKYQGIDTSFLVASLTAALQEAVARIEALEAKSGV